MSFYFLFNNKEVVANTENKTLFKNLDFALSLYVFAYWSYNEQEENISNLKIALLFREFFNFFGWDQMKLLANYKIVENFHKSPEEYTQVMLSDNLPELSDDFVFIFMNEKSYKNLISLPLIKQFITEFINLLYNEGIINYIMEPVE